MKCYFCQNELQIRDSFTYQYCKVCESVPGIKFAATSRDGICFIRFYIDKTLYGWFINTQNKTSVLKAVVGSPSIVELPFIITVDPNSVIDKARLYITFS